MRQTSHTHPAKQTHNMTPFATEEQMKAERKKYDETYLKKKVDSSSTSTPKISDVKNVVKKPIPAERLVTKILNLANRTKNFLKAHKTRIKQQISIPKPKF